MADAIRTTTINYDQVERIAGWVSSRVAVSQDKGDIEQECIAVGLELMRDRPDVAPKLATTIMYRAGLRYARYMRYGTRGSRRPVSLDVEIETADGESVSLSDTVADTTVDVGSEAIVALVVASLSSEERHTLQARLDGAPLSGRRAHDALEIGRKLAVELDALAGRCPECAVRTHAGATHRKYCSQYVRGDVRHTVRGARGFTRGNPDTTRMGNGAIAESTVSVYAPTGTSARPIPSVVNYHPLARVRLTR